jgi:hypothetical protein
MENSTTQGNAVLQAIKGVQGLFANINKGSGGGDNQTIEPQDEYTSKLSDEEIKSLTADWKKTYRAYYDDIEKTQKTAFDYWIGKQKTETQDTLEGRDIVVNKLFEAIETFLPIATRANPDALVSADNSPEGQALAKDVKEALRFQADEQVLRRKLARMVRDWMINRIGVIEVDYDIEIDDIKTTVILPKRVIFDKDGSVDEKGFFNGEYIGVSYKVSAGRLMQMFPNKKGVILAKTAGKKGTKLEYIKWWYRGLDVFFTLDSEVLGKFKNPHWNYDGEVKRIDPITQAEIVEEVQGKNHLKKPTTPYVFLSIFNTGLQPHDDTSLILQNITQQNQINKRYRQLDKNIDAQNNGIVVDGRVMDSTQAAEAASALRRGASIRVMGNPNEVIGRPQIPQLPSDVWTALNKAEQELSNIFGTSGSTPSGIKSEETARGKIMVNQLDASRIGGGITEYIEQVADSVYNLWVQMMFVHYDTEHFVNSIGGEMGAELSSLINTRFTKTLNITVKEGTMVPKDPLTQRNQAIDLWSAGAIDPLSLNKALEMPDPVMATQNLILWQMLQKGQIQPQMYLPSFQMPQPIAPQGQAGGLPPEQGVGGPAVNPIGPATPPPAPDTGTQSAEQIQSKQLLQSVPVR